MSQSPKLRLVQKVFSLLRKKYDAPEKREPLPVLETVIMAILADGTTTEKAEAIFKRLKQNYFDWNEVRVSAGVELQDQLSELPDAENRAARLKGALKFIFETTYGFDLETLTKVPMKEVAKRFEKMPHVSDYLVNRVIRDGLGGTAMPLDASAARVLRRVGLIDDKNPPAVLSASLARHIPRARNAEFCHVLSEFAEEYCTEVEPRCKPCSLLDLCPHGRKRVAELQAAAAAAAAKRTATKAKKQRSKAR